MAKQTKTEDTKASKADIQLVPGSNPFVTNLKDLPKTQRSAHTYEWLQVFNGKTVPKEAVFTAKLLAQAGVYKTPAAAASTLMRMHRLGLIKRVQKDGKDVKGAYNRV